MTLQDGLSRREMLSGATAAAAGRVDNRAAPAGVFDLWPGPPPGSPAVLPVERLLDRSLVPSSPDRILTGVARPRLDHYPAADPTGAAVVVAPGGGYVRIAIDKEGVDIGRWLSDRGVSVFVLTYRLPGDGWENAPFAAVADAQRAMRWVRYHAARFRIDPRRVGLLGFSAGGHVAASVMADEATARYPACDRIDDLAFRPDFMGLFYPVLDMSETLAHAVSRKAIFDASRLPPSEAETQFSPNRRVPRSPPPTFLCCALDDPSVPPDNTLAMIRALRARDGRVEAHLFERGGHGFGIRKTEGLPVSAWPELFRGWLVSQGVLPRDQVPR
jgi:acetyl esterase/lipase